MRASTQVDSGVQVPEISERQGVWNCVQLLKKTATGRDLIPFWVWRDHAEICTHLICNIRHWGLLPSPHCGKNLTWPPPPPPPPPLPQGWLSQEKDRLQRIQHTPVIAHAFEKSVYNIHARGTVEQHLSSTQFAYRTRGGGRRLLLSGGCSSVCSTPSIVI